MGAFSIWHLVIVLLIVILLFGTKRLRNIGTDLGNAIKSFRSAVKEEGKEEEEGRAPTVQGGPELPPKEEQAKAQGRVIEGEATRDNSKS